MSALHRTTGPRRFPGALSDKTEGLPQVLSREFPVEQFVDDDVDVGGTLVLVIEVIRVLSNVDREQRLLAAGERDLGVAGLYDLQRTVVKHEPAPA